MDGTLWDVCKEEETKAKFNITYIGCKHTARMKSALE